MADAVASRMRRAGMVGRTVTLKIRFGDFATRTRSRTNQAGLADGREVAALAGGLLGEVDVSPGIRLLGVGVSNLSPAGPGPPEQMKLDLGGGPSSHPRLVSAAGAVDSIRERFGPSAVGPATSSVRRAADQTSGGYAMGSSGDSGDIRPAVMAPRCCRLRSGAKMPREGERCR